MNETGRAESADDTTDRFPSLASQRAAQAALLKLYREQGNAPQVIARIEDFIRRGRATGALLDAEEDRWASQGLLDFWATTLFRAGREPPDATLEEFDPLLAPELDDALCPYLGLDAFREKDERLFFGRQRLVTEAVGRLAQERLLVVVGSSGSGKSSLVLAGLLPALKGGAVPGSQGWRYCPPMVPGSNPLANLARALQPPGEDTGAWIARQVEALRQDEAHLAELAGSEAPLVLVIDQFEEVFTLCEDDVARQAFIDNLVTLVCSPDARHTAVITMRVDFEPYVVRLPGFQSLYEAARVRVPPLTAGELRASIEEPAALVGLKFEGGVVDALLHDILGEPAALPLLQFTLLKLWEGRERNRVTWETYHQLGGGRQALAHSADEFYEGLIPEEQVTARRILLRMVRPGEGLEVTSNRIRRGTLYRAGEARDRVDRVLGRFVEARLLRLTGGDEPGDEQVEVAHEALVRNWPRLVTWLEDKRERMRRRRRLTSAAEQWHALGRDAESLWRGAMLDEALRYEDLNELEAAFVRASREEIEAQREREIARQRELARVQATAEAAHQRAEERAQAARRFRRLAMVLAAVFLLAVIAAVFAGIQQRRAQASERLAVAAQMTVEAGAGARLTEVAVRSTAEARALENEGIAATRAAEAVAAQGTAEARRVEAADAQATAEARRVEAVAAYAAAEEQRVQAVNAESTAVAAQEDAEAARDRAEEQLRLSTSRALAAAALVNLDRDPERSILLAVHAVSATYTTNRTVTYEAEDALHQAVQASRVQLTLCGHADRITAAAFSPDGTRIATASADRTAKIWDAVTGEELHTLESHEGWVVDVAFSPDGAYVATASWDRSAMIWEARTGRLQYAITGHEGVVRSVAFSPDGTHLATASDDGTVRIWDLVARRHVRTLAGHEKMVWGVAYSPDGTRLATASEDGTAKVWDAATGQELFTLSGHLYAVHDVAFGRDGKWLVTSSLDNTIKVWDAVTGDELQTLAGHTNGVWGVDFDGQVATASADRTAKVWNAATGKELFTLFGHTDTVNSVAFSADGTRLVTASDDGTARVWNAAPGGELGVYSGHRDLVMDVAFDPHGTRLATASFDGTARVWDVETGTALHVLRGHDGYLWGVAYSPDGTLIATAGEDGTARVWDAQTGEELFTVPDEALKVYDVAFSPDGETLVTAGSDRTAKVWDLESGEISATLRGHGDLIWGVAYSFDGTQLATASADRTVRLWDAESGGEVCVLEGFESWVADVAFSPDGAQLATASADGTAVVWDVATCSETLTLADHTGTIRHITFNGDGTRIATASYDKTVKVWDAASGQALLTLSGQTDKVYGVAFAPGGTHLAAAGRDGVVRMYTLNVEELVALSCRRVTRNLTPEEWATFMGSGVSYRETCPGIPPCSAR